MARFKLLGLVSLAILGAAAFDMPAQSQERPLILRVTPRSFLDPGTAAPVGSLNRYATQGQTSFIAAPPWNNNERFGGSVLPDPIGGPYVGARNPFPALDFNPPLDSTGAVR